jgi:hypothetical protein
MIVYILLDFLDLGLCPFALNKFQLLTKNKKLDLIVPSLDGLK